MVSVTPPTPATLDLVVLNVRLEAGRFTCHELALELFAMAVLMNVDKPKMTARIPVWVKFFARDLNIFWPNDDETLVPPKRVLAIV